MRIFIALLTSFLVLSLFPFQQSFANPVDSIEQAQFEKEVIQLVNKERKKQGLKPLSVHDVAAKHARHKSEDMRDRNYFSHQAPTGEKHCQKVEKEIKQPYCGENIASGYTTPQEVFKGWMNSEAHRNNILNPSYTHTGVGYAKGGELEHYWTQIFVKVK